MNPRLVLTVLLILTAPSAYATSSESLLPLDGDQLYCYRGRDCIRARQVLGSSNYFDVSTTEVYTWDPTCFSGTIKHYSWSPTTGMLLHGTDRLDWDIHYMIVYDPPRVVLPPNISVGQSWSNSYEASCVGCPEHYTGSFTESYSVEAHEAVQVPYGEFLAYRVMHQTALASWDVWYAPDVGLVKHFYRDGVDPATVLVSNCSEGIPVESRSWTALKAMY